MTPTKASPVAPGPMKRLLNGVAAALAPAPTVLDFEARIAAEEANLAAHRSEHERISAALPDADLDDPAQAAALREQDARVSVDIARTQGMLLALRKRLAAAELAVEEVSFQQAVAQYDALGAETVVTLAEYSRLGLEFARTLMRLSELADAGHPIERRFEQAGRRDQLFQRYGQRPGHTDRGIALFEHKSLLALPRIDGVEPFYIVRTADLPREPRAIAPDASAPEPFEARDFDVVFAQTPLSRRQACVSRVQHAADEAHRLCASIPETANPATLAELLQPLAGLQQAYERAQLRAASEAFSQECAAILSPIAIARARFGALPSLPALRHEATA